MVLKPLIRIYSTNENENTRARAAPPLPGAAGTSRTRHARRARETLSRLAALPFPLSLINYIIYGYYT